MSSISFGSTSYQEKDGTINSLNSEHNLKSLTPCHQVATTEQSAIKQEAHDSFELSNSTPKLDKINFLRLVFSRLTDEQVKIINETGVLPEGSKFIEATDGNGYKTGCPVLTWNIFGITSGTQEVPEGYELKNDILGFTHTVRKGTKGLIYK